MSDFLSFSFHKLLAPFGVGVLYGKKHLLESMRPCLYGGDMVAQGGVAEDHVEYNELPWKFAAGTPNILGTVVSAQALRLLIDLVLTPDEPRYFRQDRPLERRDIRDAMNHVTDYTRTLTERALASLARIPGLRIYGPADPRRRTSLVAFNIAGWDPIALAEALSRQGVESRAGCHCATLAHRFLGLDPPASCRLSFYFYNTPAEVDRATAAVASLARRAVEAGRCAIRLLFSVPVEGPAVAKPRCAAVRDIGKRRPGVTAVLRPPRTNLFVVRLSTHFRNDRSIASSPTISANAPAGVMTWSTHPLDDRIQADVADRRLAERPELELQAEGRAPRLPRGRGSPSSLH